MITIAAISTAVTSAGAIGIVRLSGENALEIAKSIFTTNLTAEFSPSKMYLGTIFGETFKEKTYLVYFKAPRSFTGEDVVEFHCHGGIGILNAVLSLTLRCGARPALPGEFTKRAFLNGKLSLDKAEGVGEMISAESESAMLEAYRLMDGELSKGIYKIEESLRYVLAKIEGSLDYPDELSYENDEIRPDILSAKSSLLRLFETSKRGKLIKNGINVAIIGLPNAGKSSLLNKLLLEDRAIVTAIPGTTRDTLSESINYKGYKITFTDTAGIRNSEDAVEKLGIERSKRALLGADIALIVLDASAYDKEGEKELFKLAKDKKSITVLNKIDIKKYDKNADISISCLREDDTDKVLEKVLNCFDLDSGFSDTNLMLERHIYAVKSALESIESAYQNLDFTPPECTATDIKNALSSLAGITGSIVTEDTVDEIFSRFCVGK